MVAISLSMDLVRMILKILIFFRWWIWIIVLVLMVSIVDEKFLAISYGLELVGKGN